MSGLGARQEALVLALTAGGPVPDGFDPVRMAVTRRALLRKRAGLAALRWPVLRASHGERWNAVFAAHHDGRPSRGALADGFDVARALAADGALTSGALAELADHEALWHYDGSGEPRRRSTWSPHRLRHRLLRPRAR